MTCLRDILLGSRFLGLPSVCSSQRSSLEGQVFTRVWGFVDFKLFMIYNHASRDKESRRYFVNDDNTDHTRVSGSSLFNLKIDAVTVRLLLLIFAQTSVDAKL